MKNWDVLLRPKDSESRTRTKSWTLKCLGVTGEDWDPWNTREDEDMGVK